MLNEHTNFKNSIVTTKVLFQMYTEAYLYVHA